MRKSILPSFRRRREQRQRAAILMDANRARFRPYSYGLDPAFQPPKWKRTLTSTKASFKKFLDKLRGKEEKKDATAKPTATSTAKATETKPAEAAPSATATATEPANTTALAGDTKTAEAGAPTDASKPAEGNKTTSSLAGLFRKNKTHSPVGATATEAADPKPAEPTPGDVPAPTATA